MCGPTGIGFLYGKHELLNAMPPFLGKHVCLLSLTTCLEIFQVCIVHHVIMNHLIADMTFFKPQVAVK